MKKAVNAAIAESSLNMEETFAAIAKAGFEGIELGLDREKGNHSLSMASTEEDFAKVRELSEKYQLPVTSLCSGYWGSMMGVKEQHEEAATILFRTIEAAKAVGAGAILIVPGGMGNGVTLDQARRNCIKFLKKYKEEIERQGIYVGVENVWNGFFLSPYDMASFIDEVDSSMIGAYLDVGNIIAISEPEYWIEILGNRIGRVHVKDFLRTGRINAGGAWKDITHGTGNWKAIIPLLRKAGYDGYVVGEVFKRDEAMPYEDYYIKVSGEIGEIITY